MNASVVISYLVSRWIMLLIIFILLSILFIIFSLVKNIKKYRWWIFLAFLIVSAYVTVPTIQGAIDISCNSYVTEIVDYYRSGEENTGNSIIAAETVQITNSEGKTVILKGATQNFPYGRYTGTVTYSKTSKIIISFIQIQSDN